MRTIADINVGLRHDTYCSNFVSVRCAMARVMLVSLLTFGCLAGASSAQDRKPDQNSIPPGLRVFFASHSLMWYAPQPLGEMAKAGCVKGHKLVGLQSLGASKTIQHWNLPDDKNQAKKALKAGEVDVLVMSPISFPDARAGGTRISPSTPTTLISKSPSSKSCSSGASGVESPRSE